jgi:hypothetical protein
LEPTNIKAMPSADANALKPPLSILIYERFDFTLGDYLRSYIRNLLPTAHREDLMTSYIINLMQTLMGMMVAYVRRVRTWTVYMVASQASNYVIYIDAKTGMLRRISVMGWSADNMFNVKMLGADIAAARSNILFIPGSKHGPANPKQAKMFATLLLQVKAQPKGNYMDNYIQLLFRMVLWSELVDAMQIIRNELLRNIYSTTALDNIEMVTLDTYDKVTTTIVTTSDEYLTNEFSRLDPDITPYEIL